MVMVSLSLDDQGPRDEIEQSGYSSLGLKNFLSMTDSPSNQILARYDVLSTKIFMVYAINFIGLGNKNRPGQIYFVDFDTTKSNN